MWMSKEVRPHGSQYNVRMHILSQHSMSPHRKDIRRGCRFSRKRELPKSAELKTTKMANRELPFWFWY